MDIKILLRGLSLTAVLMAGSCAAPIQPAGVISEDPAVNHPIAAEPSYQAIKLYYTPGQLAPSEQVRLEGFVSDYVARGNGSIAVSAPSGPASQAMIGSFAQAINNMGVSKDHIIVATHDAPDGDMRVSINYVSYQTRTDRCGQWTENLAYSADNLTPKNFGCSVQQNIAAQLADPRDLLSPRTMDVANAARRALVIDNYQQGKVTQAEKHTVDSGKEQSAPGSDVGR